MCMRQGGVLEEMWTLQNSHDLADIVWMRHTYHKLLVGRLEYSGNKYGSGGFLGLADLVVLAGLWFWR